METSLVIRTQEMWTGFVRISCLPMVGTGARIERNGTDVDDSDWGWMSGGSEAQNKKAHP